jgi:hypothetical protein
VSKMKSLLREDISQNGGERMQTYPFFCRSSLNSFVPTFFFFPLYSSAKMRGENKHHAHPVFFLESDMIVISIMPA